MERRPILLPADNRLSHRALIDLHEFGVVGVRRERALKLRASCQAHLTHALRTLGDAKGGLRNPAGIAWRDVQTGTLVTNYLGEGAEPRGDDWSPCRECLYHGKGKPFVANGGDY